LKIVIITSLDIGRQTVYDVNDAAEILFTALDNECTKGNGASRNAIDVLVDTLAALPPQPNVLRKYPRDALEDLILEIRKHYFNENRSTKSLEDIRHGFIDSELPPTVHL
jgi:hypothetical protein